MKRIQKLLLKLRDPSPAVLILLIICSTVLLIYTFTREAPNPGIQYFSYLFSAYTLVVLCIAAPRIAKKIYAALLRVNIFRRYKTDAEFRMQLGLYTGLGINLAFVVFKFATGVYYRSLWLGAVAVYYLMLSIIRFYVLKSRKQIRELSDEKEKAQRERTGCRTCGWLLLILDIAIAAMAMQMILKNEVFRYPGTLIYVSAAYTFYRLVIVIYQYVKNRRSEHLLFSAVGALNLSVALMSMFALQTAMFSSFGDDDTLRFLMNSVFGGAVCIACLCIAVVLLIRSGKKTNS